MEKNLTQSQATVDGILSSYTSDTMSWSDDDEMVVDPTKFSRWKKIHVIIAGFTCTFNGNLGSSMPSGALDAIAEHFNVTNHTHLVLLNSLYMVGYVLGPLLFAPMCEYVGRRPVLIGTFLGYIVFMLACSEAPTYPALLIFRLLCGINAAAPTSIIGGLYADIIDDPSVRGNALAFYMTVTTFGPYIGPMISGFSSSMGWQWPFWIAVMIAAPGLPFVLTLPETYAPVLQNKMMRSSMKERKNDGTLQDDQQAPCPFEARKIFLRPITLLFTEPIVLSTSVYLTLAYSVMYLMFQAYPIVFQDFYGLTPGMASLAYIPLCLGVLIAFATFLFFTWYRDRQAKAGKAWANNEVYRRLPLACIASPCMVISLFWLGWTVSDSIPPIVPMIGGVFFSAGMQMLFMGMINYMTDVFRQSSASAHAAASWTRSTGAILLPFAAEPMYRNLGLHWAPSVLGFLALGMGAIPFIFLKYGDRLARSSKTAREAYGIHP